MQTITEYAPTIIAIAVAGVLTLIPIRTVRLLAKRRDERRRERVGGPDDNTGWVLGWNRKPNPIRPDQLIAYTGTARLPITDGKTVEAEVVSYEDENTRLVTR